MKYDFDQVFSRRGSNSFKWDAGAADLLPMWVADMDFAIAKPIQEAIIHRAEHPVFGYSLPPAEYFEAPMGWLQRRHGWKTEKSWYSHCPGIVPALHIFAKAFFQPGEKVLMQMPVYYPFFGAAKKNNVPIVENELIYKDGRYEIDFANFEAKAKDPLVKVFYLCSPHNPGGRMWTKEELQKMGDICTDNGVLIISDEIHCDLVFKNHGKKHIPMAAISEKIAQNTITAIAPSKTFNLAGLQTSFLIISNPEIKAKYDKFMDSLGIMRPNAFGIQASMAAFNEGDEWLEQALDYLEGNLEFLRQYLAKHLPGIKIMEPDATYLIWMDFRELQVDSKVFHDALLEEGKVWLDEGYIFGPCGQGFERINIACPQALLEEGLNRMKSGLKKAGIIK